MALGLLAGVFLIWRLSRAWDLDEEKILDLTLLVFLGGLIGARAYFVLEHFQLFLQNLPGIFFFNKIPGFSFWGAILGGWLALFFLVRNKRWDFWLITDIAAIGFLGGLILADIGCFLGGCSVGIRSDLFLAVNMAGVLGKRFPAQALEAFFLFLALLSLWSQAVRFHPHGKILSLSLIYIGVAKLLTEPFREVHGEGPFLSTVLVTLGITIFYKCTKRSLRGDVSGLGLFIYKLMTDSLIQKTTLARIKKYWYSRQALIFWKLRNIKKFKEV